MRPDLGDLGAACHSDRERRRSDIPDRAAEQPLHPVRGPVPGPLSERPSVTPGQITYQRGGVLTRLQPRLHPDEARPQQFQQLTAFPPAQPGAYPGGSSRLRFCCLHTRIIARRLRYAKNHAMLSSRSDPEWLLPYYRQRHYHGEPLAGPPRSALHTRGLISNSAQAAPMRAQNQTFGCGSGGNLADWDLPPDRRIFLDGPRTRPNTQGDIDNGVARYGSPTLYLVAAVRICLRVAHRSSIPARPHQPDEWRIMSPACRRISTAGSNVSRVGRD